MTRSNSVFDSPLFNEDTRASSNNDSKLEPHKTQALLPWSENKIKDECIKTTAKINTPAYTYDIYQNGFKQGVRAREGEGTLKMYSPVEVSLLPWSEEKVHSVLAERDPKSQMTPQEVVSFKAGVICRENPDISKPFAAPGAWFPIDVLGNPMRETSPGKWEGLREPSSSLVRRITTAYEQGVGQANRDDLPNPYKSGLPEYEAWAIGRVFGKSRYNTSNLTEVMK
jgi:hypothetical protein